MWIFVLLNFCLLKQTCFAFVIGGSTNDLRIRRNEQRQSLPPLRAEILPIISSQIILQYDPLFQVIQDKISSNITTTVDATRIFHGRGGCFPGCEHLTLDWFPPVWLLTSHNIELSQDEIASIQDATRSPHADASSNFTFVYQYRNDTGSDTQIISSEGDAENVPKPHVVAENGMKFLVNVLSNQNNGIFLDMANGRTWVRENTRNENVLNMFAYTCGFSVAALSGGASQVVNIDMAAGPMKNGKRNHGLNNLQGARFLTHNIFKTWGKLRKLGPYDTIIVDPPSFQKKSFIAKTDYCKILRRLPDLLTEDGKVLLCLNAPSLDTTWLHDQVNKEAPDLEFVERVPNPEVFQAMDPERALKVILYQKR